MDVYLENYIIAETKERVRIELYWYIWLRRGWLLAMSRDIDIVEKWGWGIIE